MSLALKQKTTKTNYIILVKTIATVSCYANLYTNWSHCIQEIPVSPLHRSADQQPALFPPQWTLVQVLKRLKLLNSIEFKLHSLQFSYPFHQLVSHHSIIQRLKRELVGNSREFLILHLLQSVTKIPPQKRTHEWKYLNNLIIKELPISLSSPSQVDPISVLTLTFYVQCPPRAIQLRFSSKKCQPNGIMLHSVFQGCTTVSDDAVCYWRRACNHRITRHLMVQKNTYQLLGFVIIA